VGRVVVHREGDLTLPVDVVLEDTRGQRRLVHWSGQGDQVELPYEGAAPLRAARVDPWGRVPLDASRIDNARLADGQPARSAMPAVARVAYWFGLLLQAVGP